LFWSCTRVGAVAVGGDEMRHALALDGSALRAVFLELAYVRGMRAVAAARER
jgi:hypothetical protein